MICILIHPHDWEYMDITWKFPYKSTHWNKYILSAHHVYSNAILGLPVKNGQAATIKNTWIKLNEHLNLANSNPDLWMLDK